MTNLKKKTDLFRHSNISQKNNLHDFRHSIYSDIHNSIWYNINKGTRVLILKAYMTSIKVSIKNFEVYSIYSLLLFCVYFKKFIIYFKVSKCATKYHSVLMRLLYFNLTFIHISKWYLYTAHLEYLLLLILIFHDNFITNKKIMDMIEVRYKRNTDLCTYWN